MSLKIDRIKLSLSYSTFRLLDETSLLAVKHQIDIVEQIGVVLPENVAMTRSAVMIGRVVNEKALHQWIGTHEWPEIFVQEDFLVEDELRTQEDINEIFIVECGSSDVRPVVFLVVGRTQETFDLIRIRREVLSKDFEE
jgi:hypothetical protein